MGEVPSVLVHLIAYEQIVVIPIAVGKCVVEKRQRVADVRLPAEHFGHGGAHVAQRAELRLSSALAFSEDLVCRMRFQE